MAISDMQAHLRRPAPQGPRFGLRAAFAGLGPSVLAAALVLNLLGLALPLATLHIYDRVLPNGGVETLWALVAGLVAVTALEFLLRAMQSATLAPMAAWRAAARKGAALGRLLAAQRSLGEREPPETLEQFAAIDQLAAFEGGPSRLALVELPFAVIALALIAVIAGPLALAPLAVLALYALCLATLGSEGAAQTRRARRGFIASRGFLSAALRSIVSVKGARIERILLRRHEAQLRDASRRQSDAVALATRFQRASGLFGAGCFGATLFCGAIMAIQGDLSLGAVAASTLLAGRAAQPALRAAAAWREIHAARIAAEDAAALIGSGEPSSACTRPPIGPPVAQSDDAPRGPPAISWAEAPDRQTPPGALILARGGDAARRAAFLEQVAGLSGAGRVLHDGAPACESRAQGGVVYVPRAPTLFTGTVLENLTLFGAADEAEALRLAATFALDDDLTLSPSGYDTRLQDGSGAPIRYGARKKIALSRAMASHPRLLVLDEPIAGLDPVAATAAVEAVLARRGDVTLVLASDDPRLNAAADLVIDLTPGAAWSAGKREDQR